MDTSTHDFAGLFAQLGLPHDAAGIAAFINGHVLPAGTRLCDAHFWQPQQARFLAEELARDGDWAEVIDALAVRLSN